MSNNIKMLDKSDEIYSKGRKFSPVNILSDEKFYPNQNFIQIKTFKSMELDKLCDKNNEKYSQ